jgi:nucleosome binding factor SPN SPT16 subunit
MVPPHRIVHDDDPMCGPQDYTKPVTEVKTIETKAYDGIKEWLEQCELPYTEGPSNLNWKKIMKTIVEDPEGFFAEDGAGGWTGVLGGVDEEDGEDGEEEEESEGFEVDSEELEEESDSDFSSDEDDSDEGSASEGSLESGESSGQDWDELEAKAAADDRRRGGREEEPAPAPKKRKATGPPSRGASKTGGRPNKMGRR